MMTWHPTCVVALRSGFTDGLVLSAPTPEGQAEAWLPTSAAQQPVSLANRRLAKLQAFVKPTAAVERRLHVKASMRGLGITLARDRMLLYELRMTRADVDFQKDHESCQKAKVLVYTNPPYECKAQHLLMQSTTSIDAKLHYFGGAILVESDLL